MKRRHLLLASLAACGGTGRSRRTFPVEIAAKLPTAPNDFGWAVTLERASVGVGPVRFFTGKVAIARRFDLSSLFIGTAYAHPGHYMQGEALAELLTTAEVDLLGAPVELGIAEAVTGEYGSLQLTLGNPGATLAGTATKDGTTVRFVTSAVTPPTPLEGVAFERDLQTELGAVRIEVEIAKWLRRMDFSKAPVVDGLATVDSGEALNGFERGIEDTSAYLVTWINP